MPYIIEKIILFDEVKGTLSNIETNDEISLPPTAGCIFLSLLRNDSCPVERSQFIEQVYSKFGYDLSNNTLNQYISLLRKTIRNLGIESEVIITVPRVGFYISPELNIEKKSISFSEPSGLRIDSIKINKNKRASIATIIIAFVITHILFYLSLSSHVIIENYPLKKNGKIGECDLYLSINLYQIQSVDSTSAAAKLANRYLPCTPGSVFIYDIDSLNFLNGTGKVYLSRCTGRPDKEIYAVCSEVTLNEE